MGEVDSICLYIISTHYGTFYTGITNNLIRRWREHNTGKSSYLKRVKAKEIVYVEFFNDRRIAHKQELKVKKFGARKYLIKMKFKGMYVII